MTLRLTPEQEERINAVVSTGAYASPEEAINAAVAAVEAAATVHFDGPPDELESLLMEALESPELSEDEFWTSVDSDTNHMTHTRKPEPGA